MARGAINGMARPGPARPGSDQARSGLTSPATERKSSGLFAHTHRVLHITPKDSQDQYGFPSGWPRPALAPRTHCLKHAPLPHRSALHGPARLGSARPVSARLDSGPHRPDLTHNGPCGLFAHTHRDLHITPKDSQDQYGFASGWPRPALACVTHGPNTPWPGTGSLC